tara:strand:+ start:1493 stop:1780 length:288 start_codon:yes stop_codon:yes gene_type:complete
LGYINVGQGDATFHLFHGECEDYKREFILPLEDILNERGAVRVFLDYGKLTYVSRKEALAINRLKKTISLLHLDSEEKNMCPSVSLALCKWGHDG